MAYKITTGNPPNPIHAMAGKKPGFTFFDNLAETLNAGHANNSLHIYSQGFEGDVFQATNNIIYDQISIRATVPSKAHSVIRLGFRAQHNQAGSSVGTVNIKVYDGNANGSQIGGKNTVISQNNVLLNDSVTINQGNGAQNSTVEITIGLGAPANSNTVLKDLYLSWKPLSSVATTESGQGTIIPVGDSAIGNDEAMSAPLGFALINTATTLLKRRRMYAAVCGIQKSGANSSNTDNIFIHPFVRPHIVFVHDSDNPLTVNYCIEATNTSSTDKILTVAALDPRTLFHHYPGRPNPFQRGERGELKRIVYNGNATMVITGTLQIQPPFQRLDGISDGHFIALAVGTAAMAGREHLEYNSFDNSLRIRRYSFFGE